MSIYGWREASESKKTKSFTVLNRDAYEIFNMVCEPRILSEYWNPDKGDLIGDYLRNSIIKEYSMHMNDEGLSPYLFVFCNHDGDSDLEVLKAFIDYARILCVLDGELLIKISTDIVPNEHTYWIINRNMGVVEYDSEDSEGLVGNTRKIFAQHNVLKAQQELEEAKQQLSEMEDDD